MEENFEKKPRKKVGIIISSIIAVLIIIVLVGILFINYTRKPERIFSKAINKTFEMTENKNDNSAKIEISMSIDLESSDPEIKTLNQILKGLKINSVTEIDLDKRILNENISAKFTGMDIINIDALVQENKIYLYLNEIYSKHIQIPKKYLDGIDLDTFFEKDEDTDEINEDSLKEVKKLIINEINSKELNQESVEHYGERMQKTTVRLTMEEALEIMLKVLEVINRSEPTQEITDLLEEYETISEEIEEFEGYVDISLYTKGLTSNLVETQFSFIVPENGEILNISVETEEENCGTIKIKINMEEGESITLKIGYNVDYDAEIEERKVINTINLDNLKEEDYQEMLKNIENNIFLYSIIEQFMVGEDEYYEEDFYYDYNYTY